MNAWMKPNETERIQTTHEGLPTVAAMPPIENRTSAGTPLAIQNASFHPIVRWSSPTPAAALPTPLSVVTVIAFLP